MPIISTSKSAQVREALEASPNKSASEIAKEVGVSSALVYNVKAKITKQKSPKAAKKKRAGNLMKSNVEVNKAARIRGVAKSIGKKVRPRDVIAELAKEGVVVSSAQVSTTLRAAGYRSKRHGRKAAASVASPVENQALNLGSLLAAKAFIDKAGSVEGAEAALAALKRLT
jgi:transposase